MVWGHGPSSIGHVAIQITYITLYAAPNYLTRHGNLSKRARKKEIAYDVFAIHTFNDNFIIISVGDDNLFIILNVSDHVHTYIQYLYLNCIVVIISN